MTKGDGLLYNVASLYKHSSWLLLVSLLCWHPCCWCCTLCRCVPPLHAPATVVFGFLALLASLLLLAYPLPLATLPPPTSPVVCFLALLASLLLLVYPLPLQRPSLLPLLLLLASLFCWHPCCCWCTHCRWRPSLFPLLLLFAFLMMLASFLLL
jgi:hypothetical protein